MAIEIIRRHHCECWVVDRPQMAGKCLSMEKKDCTPTELGDGSAQVISSYLPLHACEVLLLVPLLVLVLVLVLVLC